MAKHAYLSASASGRWLKCPPSARLCAQEEDKGSPFAQEGTDAHELCQYLVEKALGRDAEDPTENLTWYSSEMQEAAEGYRDFILEQIREAEQHCPDPLVCIEQVLDYSKWVEHGFGTGDCVIIADDILHIIDMKYGTGVLVSAQVYEGVDGITELGMLLKFSFDVKNSKQLPASREMEKRVNQLLCLLRNFLNQCADILFP